MGWETLKGWRFHQIPSDSFTSSGNHHQPGKYLIHLSLFSSQIFWSTLGCVLSTPFGVHFCLPVLLYNFYFSLHFTIISNYFVIVWYLKVALSRKILEYFYISNINFPNHYISEAIFLILIYNKVIFWFLPYLASKMCWI